MKNFLLAFTAAFFVCYFLKAQSYNQLTIPDTLVGTTFNLTERDTLKQMIPGNQTVTAGINGNWWGPTMIWNKGDVIQVNVNNQLQDTTTIHWHGMHLPAIMDGGPHQPILPYTTWSPYWRVTNNAGLYWYHPHLHMEAEKQLTSGLGGLIIIRDSIESTLNLPRTYGVDDIPLVLTDRKFDTNNQLVQAPYGDSMMVNGVLRPQFTIPAQVVRLRILDAATERSYNIGFSDNRTFYVITTDGGLLNAPVPLTRFLISAGERVEILVNCSGQSGTTVDLMAYNASLVPNIPGGENFTNGPFQNFLGHKNFTMLHLNVGAATGGAVTNIPTTLVTNYFYNEADAALTRVVTISDSAIGPGGPTFLLNHHLFNINAIDYTVPLSNTEVWELNSTSTFSHPFHIHDVQFYILTINGAAPPAEQQGWKDVILVHAGNVVRFITKFSDYSDSLHPYMFHCHIALHEDLGMMGQFVVGNSPTGIMNIVMNNKLKIFPNPGSTILNFEMTESILLREGKLVNTGGQDVLQFNLSGSKSSLDISALNNGVYFLELTDEKNNRYIKTFLKE